MPCASDPDRSASSIAPATTLASASGTPQARNASVMKARIAAAGMRALVSAEGMQSIDRDGMKGCEGGKGAASQHESARRASPLHQLAPHLLVVLPERRRGGVDAGAAVRQLERRDRYAEAALHAVAAL